MLKVADLIGAELDYWVAKIKLPDYDGVKNGERIVADYKPSANWLQCGPLIEEYITELGGGEPEWYAERAIEVDGEFEYACEHGPTPLIAACRCIVSSVYGEGVDDA